MADRRWHPWGDLRRRTHLVLVFDRIANRFGGAFYGHAGDDAAAVVLSPDLDQVERRCALAHELVHDERRITQPGATDATMQLEEERVRRAAAQRLVPLDELLAFVAARTEYESITPHVVAEEFEVTETVATEALRQLRRHLDR